MTNVELLKRKAELAERKCDAEAASAEPWSPRNLRIYQNLASKFWAEYYAAVHAQKVA